MKAEFTFSSLFRKYRLRSEFETIKEFADALAQQGIVYEESLFSHWQKGRKFPRNRKLLLDIVSLFVGRGGIRTLEEANQLLESTGQGYLTQPEIEALTTSLPANQSYASTETTRQLSSCLRYIEKTIRTMLIT